MELRPILSAMRRNKFGALLIATQMAVTLAFLANALTLVEQRIAWSDRPSGIDEADIFVMHSETVDHPGDLVARASQRTSMRCAGCRAWSMPTPRTCTPWKAAAGSRPLT